MGPKDRIIVALDVNDLNKAISLVRNLAPHVGCFKIGLEFINAMLVSIIAPFGSNYSFQRIRELFHLLDGNIFWDGKFADIPNTTAGATREITKMHIRMFNVHASSGSESMKKAVENKGEAIILAVTVLTSISTRASRRNFGTPSKAKVLQFARDAKRAGCDGVVCSAQELKTLRHIKNFLKVTPGIRPKWATVGDQKRVMTPAEAIKAGADYLVIGRPITNPPVEIGSPVDAAKKIAEEIASAL